ncbi:site-specific integrase [Acidimicrobiia bacterium EGI L10123]|uniref:tyrosine-type recombinase/integrase n=1 Tax=Salinilacustrithrix flava TaxID=2957203 RepID=UPI003D7C33CE|nr:site-specific integrase [Acidimicrobiia bacterium EGI L10123]
MPVKNASITRRRLPGSGPGRVRWDVRWRSRSGRVKTKTFASKGAAREFADATEAAKANGGELPDAGDRTVGDAAAVWIDEVRSSARTAKTIDNYESVLRTHVVPEWGTWPLKNVRKSDVRSWLARMDKHGAGLSTRKQSRTVLRLVLGLAADRGWVGSNAAEGIRVEGAPVRQEMLFLTADQLVALADAMDEEQYRVLVMVAGTTGLRAAEIAGLRARSVDLRTGTITVCETLVEVGGRLVQQEHTKTKRNRAVPVPASLLPDLAALVKDKQPGDRVWTSPTGSDLRRSAFMAKHYKPAAAKAGLPPELRLHDLRHTAAAILISLGGHPLSVKERLGHSSIEITLNTYGHLFPALDEQLTGKVDDVLRSAKESDGADIGADEADVDSDYDA